MMYCIYLINRNKLNTVIPFDCGKNPIYSFLNINFTKI